MEGMDLDLGSSCLEVQEAGSSGIDGVYSESFGMNVMSGYPSKKLKTGEEQVNFCNMPLLSSICEMDYLLRTFGEKVKFDPETVSGKYILFYCFFLPPDPFTVKNMYHPMDLFNLCTDLYSVRDDFEMVFVPKSSGEDSYDLLLQGFFTSVPTYSLVVPAKKSHRCSFMCECFELLYPGTFKCLLVNVKKGIVVHGRPDSSMSHLTEHLQKLQKESSFDCLRSYGRIFKTLWPVIPKEQKNPFPPIGSCPIAKKLTGAELEYGDHINEMVSESKKLSPIKIGQSFDVISFLSGKDDMNYLCRNDGKAERVEVGKQTFSGKYILVCCFHLPVFRQEFNARPAQAIATACSELYSSRSDFEMVVVAKMNQLANHEVFFNHFMSGFHPSCLVVPLEHSKHRDFICKYLDLAASKCDDIQCLILDKDTDIKRNILYCGYPDFALDYGADAFPFTDEKLREVSANDHLWWNGALPPSTLGDLLGCSPYDVLYKTVSPGVHEKVTILELSSKVVGVYACIKGNLIPTLGKVYQQCRAQGLDFEIVLVYVPWVTDSLDPEVHIANIERVLLGWNISWCWFPPCFGWPNKLFNSSVSCRVRRCTQGNHEDQIIIVGPHGTFVEPYGAEIMSVCGIGAYPFGRDGIFETEMKKFEKLTLESLLEDGPRDYVYRDKKRKPVSELMGKKILLYLDNLRDPGLAFQVRRWYYEMRQYCDPDVELVLVRRHDYPVTGDVDDLRLSGSARLWYVCPFDPRHSTSVEEQLFVGGLERAAIVAFGTDGRVCSLGALDCLITSGPKGLRFDDKSDLRRDILDHLRGQGRMMMSGWQGPLDCC